MITLHRRQPATTLPVNTTRNYCPLCWTPAGREHELSCDEVTPAQMQAFLDQGAGHRPGLAFPDAARIFAGLPNGLALTVALFWAPLAALIAWRLA